MCGIAGILGGREAPETLRRQALGMIATLRHRGPDAEGVEVWPGGVLAHSRLSIIDHTGGAQPMRDLVGHVLIVFNGEIYNYLTINEELAARGRAVKTRSDTETLVNAVSEWGTDALPKLRGMFAFCAVNTKTGGAFLAVDRVGKKPLYYTQNNGKLIFASELKAILAHPDTTMEIDPQAVDEYLAYMYIPAPGTIFRGIKKLPPGHAMTFSPGGDPKVFRYWSALERREPPPPGWVGPALDEAVKLRLISDVPLGAFLSGGVDSTAVVAAMSRASSRVKTFSIGFDEAGYDESEYAKTVAGVYGTEHREFRVRADAGALFPALAWHYDEPFADSSALPTYLLSKMTRSEVTVALSGDGGDEAFVGYERYRAREYARRLAALPAPLRDAVAAAALRMLPAHPKSVFWRRAKKLLSAMRDDSADTYIALMTTAGAPLRERLYAAPFREKLNLEKTRSYLAESLKLVEGGGMDAFVASDIHTYLPGDLLVKTDRASMAVSLEVRCPFLDHELLEKACSVPAAEKAPGGRLKALLKDALKDEPLPRGFLERRKMGFGLPVSVWFRTSLAGAARELLLGERALARGYFKRETVGEILAGHERGAADHGALIWALVMFEAWHRLYVDTLTLSRPDSSLSDLI